jgi:hypothetical protein
MRCQPFGLGLLIAPGLHQVLQGRPLAAVPQGAPVQLVEQVALGVAAADLDQACNQGPQLMGGLAVLALGMGQQALRGGQADILPGRAQPGLDLRIGMALHADQQLLRGLPLPGACQAVEVLQVQKRQHMVMLALQQVGAELLPARADIDAFELQPRQQRYGADLVLRIGRHDAPDLAVMQLQRFVMARILHQEQRQVPPVVRLHEGVEPRPAAARALHEGQTLVHTALGQQHMGQRMVGPGLLEAQLQRLARRALGLAQQMALLIGKGQHAVEVGDIGAVRLGRQRHAQHGGRVAQVEGMVVRELERGQIARVVLQQCFEPLRSQGRVAIGPGLDGGQPLCFALMGLRQLGAGTLQKGPRLPGGLRIFGK